MTTFLDWAGRHGPHVLFGGVFVGLLVPDLAAMAKPLMGVAAFVFTFGAFLKLDASALAGQARHPGRLAAPFAWVAVGVPLVAWALLHALPLSGGTKLGLLLCMLAPPVGGAAAMAAMLRLDPTLALTVTVGVSLCSPLLLPLAAPLLAGVHLDMEPLAMMGRLALIVVGAGIAAAALQRFAGGFVRANPHALTGVSVLGLLVVAIGAMHGMLPRLSAHPGDVAVAFCVAFLANAAFQALGAALFWSRGPTDALTIGLMSGNRSVTLVWVATLPWVGAHPDVELVFAASLFAIFLLPLPMATVLAGLRRRGRMEARPPSLVLTELGPEGAAPRP